MIGIVRTVLLGTGLAAFALFNVGTTSAVAGNATAVLELFTSQGCSSCPPADKLMGKLSQNDELVVLSLPVDYWDYLGWKDTFASPAYTKRQQVYAAQRGDRSIYTPQVVVNGQQHVVGSDSRAIAQAIKTADPLTVNVELTMNGDAIEVAISGALPDGVKAATVFFAPVSKEEEVSIGRGENHGRKVSYTNVVRSLQPIGMWQGGDQKLMFPASEITKKGADTCAIIIQIDRRGEPGNIIGAALL
ncbi:MAG: DUF1223 domain-containing protein [Stappiaceae bacterium]